MDKFNISIFDNKTFFQIINEIKLFTKYKINHYENIDLCIKEAKQGNHVVVFFNDSLKKIEKYNFPIIFVTSSTKGKTNISNILSENIKIPFTILSFEKKISSLISKKIFQKNSLINLKGYIIDKNERKIKKNNLELQLSEKEVDFLVLFSQNKNPIKRDLVLKKVWNYAQQTETHTVETHIHRLRKKILSKFNDNNFIKNNKEGYYI